MAERPYQQQLIRFGAGGLSLRPAVDVVEPNKFPIYTNAMRLRSGQVTGRPGMTELTDPIPAHARVHSISRMDEALTSSFTRIWGIDTDLYYGVSGALTLAETGFSGDPLSFLIADPPIPGTPWTYIGDSLKMRKIRADGLDLEIGLPPAVLLATSASTVVLQTLIDDFEVADYNPFAGAGGGNPPTEALVAGPVAGNALEFTTDPGAALGSYTSFADKAIGPLDLTVYSNGTPVQGTDFMHFWLKVGIPASGVAFTTMYLVSGTFTSGFIPGVTPGMNDDYYVTQPNPPVGGVFTEYGTTASPLTRDNFVGHGAADWANITGIVLVFDNTDAVASTFTFDDFYLTPSLVPADTDPPYDYRVTNYDPRTGVEGNPSPIQPEASWLSNLQNLVTIIPQAYGDADIRQRAYRRGGSLPDNWFLVGQNTVNGGPIYDANSDAAISAAPTVAIDHDQPVTSIDAAGGTLLNQPVPILFGPVNGLFYALGDPRRPNGVYQSIPDRPDYWPAVFFFPVTAAGEPLVTGCIWGGEGYVASKLRWFRMLPNLTDARVLTTQPTGATKGVISRWAMVVGPVGVEFLSDDGWYTHTGGGQTNLTDPEFQPLFQGESANGYFPIDFTDVRSLRMWTWRNYVGLQYADTNGQINHLVRDVLSNEWRMLIPGVPTAVAVGEVEAPVTGPPNLLIFGGLLTSQSYTHTGTSDDGLAIPVTIRTGCLDQQAPRQKKQYGDVAVQYQPNGISVNVRARLDLDTILLANQPLPSLGGPQQQLLNPFGDVPAEGRNISFEVSWTTALAPPLLDYIGPSYFFEPEAIATRLSDWDDGGTQTEKYFKGCVIDCDTGGLDQTVVVEGTLYDGTVTTIATLTVNAAGRRKLTFTWARQPLTLIRLRPTDETVWTRWNWQWIFDEEPLALPRWETEPVDFALPGWKTVPQMFVTLRSTALVTLTVTAAYNNGNTVVETYTIPSTAGAKQTVYLPLRAGKGVLYTFLFTIAGDVPWRLYREETTVFVKPIGGQTQIRHPFGNDDLDLVRGLQSAEGTARQPGGGEG